MLQLNFILTVFNIFSFTFSIPKSILYYVISIICQVLYWSVLRGQKI